MWAARPGRPGAPGWTLWAGRAASGRLRLRLQGARGPARGEGAAGPALTLCDPAEAQDVLGPDGVQSQQLLLRNRCPDAVVGRAVGRLPPRLKPVQDAAASLLLLLLASHQPPGPNRRPHGRSLRIRPAHRSAAKMAAASAAVTMENGGGAGPVWAGPAGRVASALPPALLQPGGWHLNTPDSPSGPRGHPRCLKKYSVQ